MPGIQDQFENDMLSKLREAFLNKLVIVWTDRTAIPIASGSQAQESFVGYLDEVNPFGIFIRRVGPINHPKSFFWLDKIVGIEEISPENDKHYAEERKRKETHQNESHCSSGCGQGNQGNPQEQ